MSIRGFLAAVLCTMALATTCIAQITYGVVTTNDYDSTTSGWQPRNIYAVDVNNDGMPDLIQDEYWTDASGGLQSTGVWGVRIANGDGTFKPAVQYSYPPALSLTQPYRLGLSSMAFGDFNGDGNIDIAMLADIDTIAVYLGKGDGTFLNPYYSSPAAPGLTNNQFLKVVQMVAADFNHDGKLDLAVLATDSGSDYVYVLPGQGNGLFPIAELILTVPGADGASGWGVQRMLLGDFDGDHNADLAVVATTGNSIGGVASLTTHLLYGNGDFTFNDTTPITSGDVVNMGSGDLNGDGRTDLFAIDTGAYRLNTYYGQSDRTFADYSQQLPPSSYYSGAFVPSPGPAMADFNDDGLNDIVTVTQSPSGLVFLVFLLATGSPGQFDLQTWNVPSAPGIIAPPVVGDFNHDGKPDWTLVGGTYPWNSVIYTGLNGTTGGLWSDCAYPGAGKGINACSPALIANGTVNFNAAAHSFGMLRKIELWVDGKKLNEQYKTWGGNAWFNYIAQLAPGAHSAAYVAADVDNTLQVSPFNLTIPSSCAAPTALGVHICAPANGSTTAAGKVRVEASSTVTGTIQRMEVWVDSTKAYTELDSNALSAYVTDTPGTPVFTVFAVNTGGTVWSSAVTATLP